MTTEWNQAGAEIGARQDDLCQPVFMATFKFLVPGPVEKDGPTPIVRYTAERGADGRYEVCSEAMRIRPHSAERSDVEIITAVRQPLVPKKPNSYSYEDALRLLSAVEVRKTEEGWVRLPPSPREEHDHYAQYIGQPRHPCGPPPQLRRSGEELVA